MGNAIEAVGNTVAGTVTTVVGAPLALAGNDKVLKKGLGAYEYAGKKCYDH